MRAKPYESCRECGTSLDDATMYRRHAVCGDCSTMPSPTTVEPNA